MDTRSTTSAAAATAPPATGDPVVRIKKEPTSSSDEMKEFAETAMNELLGWYGYDGGADDEDGADESDVPLRTRSIGDSSGPECSDSGGGGGGGSGAGGPWCGWCSRPMTDGAQATGAFCSELCFSQSRRASFKRNRTCDWCRHVRHTVAHVDVRDGARHLQFCGDKCLNQYKMHIFCRETRAHLELHPHPHAAGHAGASGVIGDAALITPDLWLRDCKDEHSPDRQTSSMSPRQPPQPASHASSTGAPSRKRYCTANRRALGSGNRRTRTATVTSYHEATSEVPQDLRVRPRSPTEAATAAAANESAARKTPSVEQPRHWPPAPPPVTVLVPYPVIIPVPVPLPLPIPIPVPEELLKRAAANSSSAATTTSTTSSTTTTPIVTSKTTTTTKVESPAQQTDVQSAPVELTTTPSVRTLRKRKRPVGKEGSGRDQQTTRRTVPA